MWLREKVQFKSRVNQIFYGGCHRSIYPRYLDDFNRLKLSVMDENIVPEELNRSREQFSKHVS